MSKRPSPRELLAERNPLMRSVVAPVDIYDQINEAEERAKQEQSNPSQLAKKPAVKSSSSVKTAKTSQEPAKKPSKKSADPDLDPVNPYSTYLRRSQVKQIKHRAVDTDVKDQHIVQQAIDEYFARHPIKS